jgi:hypothetical protein
MGPKLELAGYSPYDLLTAVCPGYAQLRNIHRFATFAQFALVVLAGLGLDHLWRHVVLRTVRLHSALAVSLRLAGSLAMVVVMAESLPGRPNIFHLPADPPGWVGVIEQQSAPHDVLAIFPMPQDDSLAQQRLSALAMYWQMRHGRAMVNGYSGPVPAEFREREVRLRSFPTADTLAELRAIGVDLVVVPADSVSELLRLSQTDRFRGAVQQVHLDDQGGVFRLLPP